MNSYIFLMAWLLICGGMILRVSRVGKFRLDLMNRVHSANMDDIEKDKVNKKDLMWRWKIYESVSFDSMVWKFWKPLKSFYPDYKFAEKKG